MTRCTRCGRPLTRPPTQGMGPKCAAAVLGAKPVRVRRASSPDEKQISLALGEAPAGKSLDRFPDGDGNYEPGNCRWATSKEQNNNKRSNRRIDRDGANLTLAQWAERTGISLKILSERLAAGWSEERALTTIPKSRRQAPLFHDVVGAFPLEVRP